MLYMQQRELTCTYPLHTQYERTYCNNSKTTLIDCRMRFDYFVDRAFYILCVYNALNELQWPPIQSKCTQMYGYVHVYMYRLFSCIKRPGVQDAPQYSCKVPPKWLYMYVICTCTLLTRLVEGILSVSSSTLKPHTSPTWRTQHRYVVYWLSPAPFSLNLQLNSQGQQSRTKYRVRYVDLEIESYYGLYMQVSKLRPSDAQQNVICHSLNC